MVLMPYMYMDTLPCWAGMSYMYLMLMPFLTQAGTELPYMYVDTLPFSWAEKYPYIMHRSEPSSTGVNIYSAKYLLLLFWSFCSFEVNEQNYTCFYGSTVDSIHNRFTLTFTYGL